MNCILHQTKVGGFDSITDTDMRFIYKYSSTQSIKGALLQNNRMNLKGLPQLTTMKHAG